MNRGSPLLSTDFLIKETLLMSVFDGSISLSCSPSSPFSSPPVSIWVSILTKILRKEKKVKTNFFEKKLSLREKMLRVPHWRTILNTYSKIYHQCYKLRS
jgi:hypothetical protein